MKALTDKNGNEITVDHVNEILKKMFYDTCHDAVESYLAYVKLLREWLNTDKGEPNLEDIAVICATQDNMLRTVRKVIYELFGIEDTDTPEKQKEGTPI